GADVISPNMSIIVGGVAGSLVVLSVVALDKLKLDDPVGAISVHLACGIWGTLAVGIFGYDGIMTSEAIKKPFLPQLYGVVAYGVVAFGFALAAFSAIKAVVGIRVSPEEELEGLDIGEHGMTAYPDFGTASMGASPSVASPSPVIAQPVTA